MECRKWNWLILVAVAVCCSIMAVDVMADEAVADNLEVAASVDQPGESLDNWVDQVKNPTSWFSWGADVRLRMVGINNWKTLNDDTAGDQSVFSRMRGRVWTKINAGDIFDFNGRIMYEGRYWWEPEAASGWDQRMGYLRKDLNGSGGKSMPPPIPGHVP